MAITTQTPDHSGSQSSVKFSGERGDDARDIERQSTRSFAQTAVPDIVTTAIGGEEMSAAIDKSEACLGYESNQTRPPESYEINFVDFPFTDEDATFEEHLTAVKREEPKYAVAPDIESRSFETVIDMADQLRQHVTEAVIVVPKDVHPQEVPDRFRVGVPLANFGSDAPWQWDDYAEASELHLLGGVPQKQLDFAKRVGNVKSVDGATFVRVAQVGEVWCPHKSRHWHETGSEQMDYYERIEASIHNIEEAWQVEIHNKSPPDYDLPVDPEVYDKHSEIEVRVERETEQLHGDLETDREYRRHGTRGARPYISLDDADCLSPRERREMNMEMIDFDTGVAVAEEQIEERVFEQPSEQSSLQNFANC